MERGDGEKSRHHSDADEIANYERKLNVGSFQQRFIFQTWKQIISPPMAAIERM